MLLPFSWPLVAGLWTRIAPLYSAPSSLERAHHVLRQSPVFDGHIDLPIVSRVLFHDDLTHVPYDSKLPGQVDLPRLRQGGVGAFFSVAYVDCNATLEGPRWTNYNNEVRDTLEQIDFTKQLEAYFPADVAFARSAADFRANWKAGKVSHFVAVEGGHSLGNSLAALRMFAELGVTYVTLAHNCHNAFADSCIPDQPAHGGLSQLGRRLVKEMNRLGVAVDLSHTSPDVQRQSIQLTEKLDIPIFYSHSGAKAVYDHRRNIGDDVLELLRNREAVVGVPFLSDFVKGAGKSKLSDVADHIEHIASIIGRSKVALGSDYDGALEFAKGLEDSSTYPALLAELFDRGWSETEVAGLTSENFLRVLDAIQAKGKEIRSKGSLPDMRPWEGRSDL
ncbi:unnamed protein product [Parajaminaea phylloscopi]